MSPGKDGDLAFDLIIRGGTVADGRGSPLFEADVAISDGRIAEIGPVAGSAIEEIDAGGRLVAPGFVDIHSHYDARPCGTNACCLRAGMASPPRS